MSITEKDAIQAIADLADFEWRMTRLIGRATQKLGRISKKNKLGAAITLGFQDALYEALESSVRVEIARLESLIQQLEGVK